jgi:hypothetical protein
VDCIHEHGGDVMRFAGDSVIALFPTTSVGNGSQMPRTGSEGADACFRALQCSAKILGLTNTSFEFGKRLSEGTCFPSPLSGGDLRSHKCVCLSVVGTSGCKYPVFQATLIVIVAILSRSEHISILTSSFSFHMYLAWPYAP